MEYTGLRYTGITSFDNLQERQRDTWRPETREHHDPRDCPRDAAGGSGDALPTEAYRFFYPPGGGLGGLREVQPAPEQVLPVGGGHPGH